ncbi:early light-inducible protein HV60 [Gracilaria domingensis]|nr:early light-inducible protein HV60 [Gracilaria domingensis]
MTVLPIFTNAMEDYKKEYPSFAARGWGASVKAERWNGRHAMFGFVMLVATAYCKGHGLLPEGVLETSSWGVLGSLGDTAMITKERAVILVAHIHVLFVSVAAALAPFSFQDKLLLAPGEADEEPAGLLPPFEPGLTKGAELWNCRVSMLGLMAVVGCSIATGTPILDVINIGLGKILY